MTSILALLTAAVVGLLLASAAARAAGGHFDVDDAAVVEPGHCQYEAWAARAPAAATTLYHLGPACRIGPVEVAVNIDRFVAADMRRSSLGPQVKWVTDSPTRGLAAGVVWGAAFDLNRGGRPAHVLYLPFTWTASDALAVNANLGADWDFAGVRTRRIGLSGEWVVHERLTFIAERLKLASDWTSRLGARFMLSGSTSIDFSVARTGPRTERLYVVGLNHDFER